MNQRPINTFIDLNNSYFDTFNEEFLPDEDKFDFVERQSLPQDFIDFVQESTKCLESTKMFPNFVNEDDNELLNKRFHLKVIELLMIFGLSFCTNDYLDYNKLKTHRVIIEEDLLITIEDTTTCDPANQEHFFSERFEYTKSLLHKVLKSAIFLFNIEGGVKSYSINNNYLNKSPVILVYSKMRGRILFPNSFRYYSGGLSFKPIQNYEKGTFYSICQYPLAKGKIKIEDINLATKAIYNFCNKKYSEEYSINEEYFIEYGLSSFEVLNVNIIGLIGEYDDVFQWMGFNIKTSSDPINKYPDGFNPNIDLNPELFLYLPQNGNKNQQGNNSAFLFLFKSKKSSLTKELVDEVIKTMKTSSCHEIISLNENGKFYSICEYQLIEDHWIPNTKTEDLRDAISAIYKFCEHNELVMREDFLSFDFCSFSNLNLNIIGLIGQCDEVFRRIGFNIQTPDSSKGFQNHKEKYPKGFYPKNKLHPELFLYLPKGSNKDSEKGASLAYMFLFVPYCDPYNSNSSPTSPISPTYEEATCDAYMRMKSCCSQVILISKNKLNKEENEQKINQLNYNYYMNGYDYIFGKKSKPINENKIPFEKETFKFFNGSNDTANYCEIKNLSFERKGTLKKKGQNNKKKGQNKNKKKDQNNNDVSIKKSKEEEIKFDSLQHFIQWIEWESRTFSISFILDDFESSTVQLNGLNFLHENNTIHRFHERTEDTRISCEISSEIFAIVRQYLIKNIRFYDENKKESKETKAKIFINKVVAYEDGQLQINFHYEYKDQTGEITKNTYKFYKIEQSPSKVAIPGYFNKIAVLHNIESNFILLNSFYIDERILLTLFYSKLEGKILIIVIHRYFNDRSPPTPIFEIKSDFEHQNNSIARTSEYYSSFHSKTRLLLFTIVEEGISKVVSVTLKTDYTGISNINIRNLDNFIPLEAKDESFLIRQKENLPNSKSILSRIPKEDKEIRFTGFIIGESYSEAVMYFNCYIELDPKDNEIIKEEGRYHFFVFFDPVNLHVVHTIKFNDQTYIDYYNAECDKLKSKGYDDSEIQNFKDQTIDFLIGSVGFPFLYINNSLLVLFFIEKMEPIAEGSARKVIKQHLSFMIVNQIKDNQTNKFNDFDKMVLTHKDSTIEPFTAAKFLGLGRDIRSFGVIKTANTIELVSICESHRSDDLNEHFPSIVKMNHFLSDFTRNKKELEQEGRIKDASIESSFLHLLIDHDNPYSFQYPDFSKSFEPFDSKSIAKLILQTDAKYGMSIIGQMTIPEPNRIPLNLSLINASCPDDEQSKLDFINGLLNSEIIHLVALNEKEDENIKNNLHKSAARFISSLFTSAQTVVSDPIVDSATMSILTYNAKRQGSQEQLKSAMQLCYTVRSRSFPSFPFLRMTSRCPIFHIGVLGERESDSSSLLSWITGIAFTNMPTNTLCIGSNSFPIFNRNYDLFEKNWSIKPDSVDGIINVVGSLFSVNQGTFAQVVGFISALSACDTIILEFTELRHIFKFFRLFFDCADTICNEFDIKFPTKQETTETTRGVNVAIFCDVGSNPEKFIANITSEIYKLIEERSLESGSSLAVQAIENIEFKFLAQTSTAHEKAAILRDIGFLDVSKCKKSTESLMKPIRNMSLIFGQQVDHEANLSFISIRAAAKEEEEYIPFVMQDEDSSRKEELFSIANQILKKSLGESDSRKEAERLLRESARQGSIKAGAQLAYGKETIRTGTSFEARTNAVYAFLKSAIKGNSEEAASELARISLDVIKAKIDVKVNEAKIKAEEAEVKAEEARKKAEEAKVEAEKARVEAEKARNKAKRAEAQSKPKAKNRAIAKAEALKEAEKLAENKAKEAKEASNNAKALTEAIDKVEVDIRAQSSSIMRKRLNVDKALKALGKFCDRYRNGEREQTSNQILTLTEYIRWIEGDEMIGPEELYIEIELMLDHKRDIQEILKLFEKIPEDQRTNHSINFRILELMDLK